MNDSDLESKLKRIPVPERSDEYWSDFPSRVRLQLRREQRESIPRRAWRPRVAWAGGFSVALALMFVFIQYHPLQAASVNLAKNQRHIRAQLTQLDAGLHTLMFNPHGMGYLLAEAN